MLQHLICQVVKIRENVKLLVLKAVAVAYERWTLTRGLKYSDLTWKRLVFWKTGRRGEVVATGSSTLCSCISLFVVNFSGPRFVLNLIRVFEGSFGGSTLYENPQYQSPNEVNETQDNYTVPNLVCKISNTINCV